MSLPIDTQAVRFVTAGPAEPVIDFGAITERADTSGQLATPSGARTRYPDRCADGERGYPESESTLSIHARQLKSGHTVYDVQLRKPNGVQYKRTFRSRQDADVFEANERASRSQGTWIDPVGGNISLEQYASEWLALRIDLRPRTVELYEGLLRLHILPALGSSPLRLLSPGTVRRWHAGLRTSSGIGVSTAAKAYRLLHTVLATAVEDELVRRNPCTIRRAGAERPAERPIATIAQISALADAVVPRNRALVLLAAWAGLRYGELAGLQRHDLDAVDGTVRVERQLTELRDGSTVLGPPKTEASRRTVAIPPHVLDDLSEHLAAFVDVAPTSPVFTTTEGTSLRRSNFNRRVWQPACREVGLADFRFHDLRHTHNTLAAMTGASTRELMARMGHSSPRAALIYQHATSFRDRTLADALAVLSDAGAGHDLDRAASTSAGGR
jgi:integrase